MRGSWQLARSTLAGRRLRTALMAAAVILASSLIVAVSSSVRTVQTSLEYRIADFVGASDARIIHPGNGMFSAALLARARAWPGVRHATGRLYTSLNVAPSGDVDPDGGYRRLVSVAAVGMDFATEIDTGFRTIRLLEGRLPAAPHEVLLDPLTAEATATGVGDTLDVVRLGDPAVLTAVGIYDRQKLGSLQQPRIYIDLGALATLARHPGELASIYLILEDGVDVEQFCGAHESALEPPLALEPAAMVRTGFDRRVAASRIGLTIATILVFLGAGFIILIGLTTGVSERQRELALMRCIGARRSDLFGGQLLVGLALGAVGAVIGVPLGIGLTAILAAVYRDYLPAGLDVNAGGLLYAVAGSMGAGLVGALFPAAAASRVSPLLAMAVQARPVRAGAIVGCGAIGAAALALMLALQADPDPERRFWTYAFVGLPALLAGWFLLSVPALLAFNSLLGPILSRAVGLPPDVLRGSIRGTPFRHGLTAAAMTVGMALLVGTWAGAASVERDWLSRIRFADGFAIRRAGISPVERDAIAALPFVEAVCPISQMPARIVDRQIFGVSGFTPRTVVCVGFDATRFFDMNAIEWVQGDPATAIARLADGDAAIVAERFLTARGVGVGDHLTIGVGRVTHEVEIVGVVSAAGLDLAIQLFGIQNQYMEYAVSAMFMDFDRLAETFRKDDAMLLQVNLDDSVTDEEARSTVMATVPGVEFRGHRWIRDTVHDIAQTLLRVQTTIALAALLLATVSVGSVIAATVQSRRYEYGVLRAVGATPGVLVRLVLAEALVVAITAAAVGTALGLQGAWVDVRHMRTLAGLPVNLGVPFAAIGAGFAIVTALAVAATLPVAIRLARQSPRELVALGRNE